MSPRVAVVVGNPKPESRTLVAATLVARELAAAEPTLVVDLATFGARLLDPKDEALTDIVAEVTASDLVVVACPTYKASYTGILKVFLDRLPSQGLRGVVAVPLMLGAGPGHALAPEAFLRPVLTELGATVPVSGLYVLDSQHDVAAAYENWLETARPVVSALIDARAGV
jgi:FMN reductase